MKNALNDESQRTFLYLWNFKVRRVNLLNRNGKLAMCVSVYVNVCSRIKDILHCTFRVFAFKNSVCENCVCTS